MDSITSCVCISVLVQRGIQNNIRHHPFSEEISNLAVKGRYEHKNVLSNNEKNFVAKNQLLVLIK